MYDYFYITINFFNKIFNYMYKYRMFKFRLNWGNLWRNSDYFKKVRKYFLIKKTVIQTYLNGLYLWQMKEIFIFPLKILSKVDDYP